MTIPRPTRLVLALAAVVPLLTAPAISGATPRHCPPGHAMKGWCQTGDRQARDDDRKRVEYRYIRDYDRYGLKRPRDGYVYVVRDDELFLINRATQEVIEGLGALSYLLRK